MKRDLQLSTVGGRDWVPEELLEFAKSGRVIQSLQLDLGRPVPCEQEAADTYRVPPLPPTSVFLFVCLGFWIMSLWLCVWGLGVVVLCFVSLGSK